MRKLLIVIDMQNDFIDGALGSKEAVSIVENVKAKIRGYDKKDVFATRDTHPENYLETQEGKFLPVKHCVENTKGWEIRSDIKELINEENVVNKPTFGSVDLAKRIVEIAKENNGEIEVELCGVCTDICVVSNALMIKANLPEITLKVDSKCCAGVTVAKHEAALETMRSCQIVVE